MLFEIDESSEELKIIEKYTEESASNIGIYEKTIEDWISSHPELLFPREQVLIIGQSIQGKSMADVLALDSYGNLVIMEIKRDWSDRSTVAQLLEYAATYAESTYEDFNRIAKNYTKWGNGELIDRFREFVERPEFSQEQLCKKQRVFIVAPDADSSLKKIVGWLQRYGVPIEFIPFKLWVDQSGKLRMIDITGSFSDIEIDRSSDNWEGHWIFNTNESNAAGAYKFMFSEDVIAIFGYENGGANLEGATAGQKVFAYVNGQGLRALGEIVDPTVMRGEGVFFDKNGQQSSEEYHVQVKWDIVLPEQVALSNSDASKMGYSLPVRTVFGHLRRGQLAYKLEEEMQRRANFDDISE